MKTSILLVACFVALFGTNSFAQSKVINGCNATIKNTNYPGFDDLAVAVKLYQNGSGSNVNYSINISDVANNNNSVDAGGQIQDGQGTKSILENTSLSENNPNVRSAVLKLKDDGSIDSVEFKEWDGFSSYIRYETFIPPSFTLTAQCTGPLS